MATEKGRFILSLLKNLSQQIDFALLLCSGQPGWCVSKIIASI